MEDGHVALFVPASQSYYGSCEKKQLAMVDASRAMLF